MDEFFIGEERHSSAGNVYRLVGIPDEQHVLIRRVGVYRADGTLDDGERWDSDVTYRWMNSQWDSLPLVGQRSHDPSFGLFVPR